MDTEIKSASEIDSSYEEVIYKLLLIFPIYLQMTF